MCFIAKTGVDRAENETSEVWQEVVIGRPFRSLTHSSECRYLRTRLGAATFATAYLVKYGQLATGLGFEPSAPAALAMVLVPPAVLANFFISRAKAAPIATESQ